MIGNDILGDLIDGLERLYKVNDIAETTIGVGDSLAKYAGTRQNVTVDVRSLFEGAGGTGAPLLGVGQPVLGDPLRRTLFLRDLCQVMPIDTMSVPFVRELAPLANEQGASGVAEGQAAGDVGGGISFVPTVVTPGMLPVNVTVSQQLFQDSSTFGNYINGRMPYECLVRETDALLFGDGSTANAGITGIANTSGVNRASGAGAGLPQAIASAAAYVANQGVNPDAVFCSPLDFWPALLAAPQFMAVANDALAICPLVDVPKGTAIVGSFSTGLIIIERAGATVSIYPQHADYAARNQVLVQGQERVGSMVIRPWAFQVVTGL